MTVQDLFRILLDDEEIEDIIKVIQKLVRKNNIKYINDIRSLSTLNSILNIKIVQDKDKFKVKRLNR